MKRMIEVRQALISNPLGRGALRVLSWLYGAAVVGRRLLYAKGWLKSRKIGPRTICIGNITTGGTGKTTAVLLAAQTLRRAERSVAILSRGYGRPEPGKDVLVLLDKENPSWRECGDEPFMMHHALKGLEVPILVSPDRVRSAETAVHYYHPDVLLLDDGFQHFRLRRDMNIVLLNASDPWGGGSLLPLGTLREPKSALKRADLVLLTHTDRVERERLDRLHEEILKLHRRVPIVESAHRPCFLFDLTLESKERLSALRDREVTALCGIGDPQGFLEHLERIGAKVAQRWVFPDHYAYTLDDLRAVERTRQGRPVVTTFKDFPRLPAGWQQALTGEVFALAIRLDITRGKQAWEDGLCPSSR